MKAPSAREALVRYLSEPAHAGVYRLEATRLDALDALVGAGKAGKTESEAESDAAGLDWRRLAAAPRWSREALLDGLAASLAFPGHFGRNWDAAWDCLTELAWVRGRPLVMVVPTAPVEETAMATFVALMEDAAEHWASRGHVLLTLIGSGGEVAVGLPELPDLPQQATGGWAWC